MGIMTNWKNFNKKKILWNIAIWKTEERKVSFQFHYHELSVPCHVRGTKSC
jgi:hypothetical protein